MRKLVLSLLALCLSAAACGDAAQAPTAARPEAEVQRSGSSPFRVQIQVAASNSYHQVRSLRAELANNSVPRDQVPLQVDQQRHRAGGGAGVRRALPPPQRTAHGVRGLTVEVTGPEGYFADAWIASPAPTNPIRAAAGSAAWGGRSTAPAAAPDAPAGWNTRGRGRPGAAPPRTLPQAPESIRFAPFQGDRIRTHPRASNRSMSDIRRRQTVSVNVGGVLVGSAHPVVVQSMTNTDTADVEGTVRQVAALWRAGSQIVRVTVNNDEAAQAVPYIVEFLQARGVDVPIVGDFHYNGHLLLTRYPDTARALAKYRINPGNVGAKRHDENFRAIVEKAIEFGKPVRIGVNWGSLDQALLTEMMDANALLPEAVRKDAKEVMMDAMTESAMRSAAFAEACGLPHDRIILSGKVSGVQDLVRVYRKMAPLSDYPFHLGLTEAGMGTKGIVSSAAGLSILLQEGIGDTIRVSLTPKPGGDRTEEVHVAQQILQSLEIRSFSPQVTSCPGCGRTTSTYFQQLAESIQGYLRDQMPVWRDTHPGVEEMKVAVMGCVVNGPGESKHANLGISLPGTFEEPKAPVYVDGEHFTTLRGDHIADEFKRILDDYVESHYPARPAAASAEPVPA